MFSRRTGQKRTLDALRAASAREPETIRVLLVGADAHRSGIAELLNKHERIDFEVLSVDTTVKCLEALDQERLDLLLVDDNLPSEERLNLVRRVAQATDSLPVVLLTSDRDERVVAGAMNRAAYDCVRKDSTDYLALGRTVHHLLISYHQEEEERRLRGEVERLTVIDTVTGLHNRRYLEEALDRECRRAQRYGTKMSFMIIDVDDFKPCCDLHGRRVGEDVLKQVAALLRKSVRATDLLAHYDGDKFCVLLPETSHEGAMQTAERLRFAIAAERLVAGKGSEPMTVSLGVFTPKREDDLQPEVMVDRAQVALNEAKASGKNRVCGISPLVENAAAETGGSAAAAQKPRRPLAAAEGVSPVQTRQTRH